LILFFFVLAFMERNLNSRIWKLRLGIFFKKNAQKGTERWDQPKQILMPTLGRTTKRELKTITLECQKNAHPGVAMDRKKKCAKKRSHSTVGWKKACPSVRRSR
jgi:hypothetical protein